MSNAAKDLFSDGYKSLIVESLQSEPDLNHPLGLRRVSDTLSNELFPGLSVYTRRAKYFTLISYWHSQGWLKQPRNLSNLDKLLVWFHSFVENADTEKMVGDEVMTRFKKLQELDPKDFVNTSIPSYNQYKNPFNKCEFRLEAAESVAEDYGALNLKKYACLTPQLESKVSEFLHISRKLSESDLQERYFEKWLLNHLDPEEEKIIKDNLGIGLRKLKGREGINRSITLGTVHEFIVKRGEAPWLRELVSSSKKDPRFSSKFLGEGVNPFKELEIFDFFLTCLDLGFNSLVGVCQDNKPYSIQSLREIKFKKVFSNSLHEIKNNFYDRMSKLRSQNESSYLSAYRLSAGTLERLVELYPDHWQKINVLLKKSLREVGSNGLLVDWLLEQHGIYSEARMVEPWLIVKGDVLHLHPRMFSNKDFWSCVTGANYDQKFMYPYRLHSINSLLKDLV